MNEKTLIPADLVRIIAFFVCGKTYWRCWTRINGRLIDVPVYDLLLTLV